MKIRDLYVTIALCLLLLVAGCQTTSNYSQTGTATLEDGVPIPQGNGMGTWTGRDLSVEYKYSRNAGQMDLSAIVNFADHMTLGYSLMEDFRLSAIFTDEKGHILEMKGVATDRNGFAPIHFQAKLAVPVSAAAISFSYQGTAVESNGDGGGNPTRFWQGPVN